MISRHLWPPSFPTGEQTHLFRYKIHIINRTSDMLFSLLVEPNKGEYWSSLCLYHYPTMFFFAREPSQ